MMDLVSLSIWIPIKVTFMNRFLFLAYKNKIIMKFKNCHFEREQTFKVKTLKTEFSSFDSV